MVPMIRITDYSAAIQAVFWLAAESGHTIVFKK